MSLVEPSGKNKLDDYENVVSREEIKKIRYLADRVQGSSVIHVNSTAFGGGVAEILHRLIPLMRDVGLNTSWGVIDGDLEFFTITKTKFHNGLQGEDVSLSKEEKEKYLN